jgi:hypothetical protein
MEPQLDLTYQAKIGPEFALPLGGGGTGRTDGGSPIVYVVGHNESGGTILEGTVVRYDDTGNGSGPATLVEATAAATDRPFGVAMEDIADGAVGAIAVLGGPLKMRVTGTIASGDLLCPSSTAGRARTAVPGALTDIGFAIALYENASGDAEIWTQIVGLLIQGATAHTHTYPLPGAVNFVFGDGTNVIAAGLKGFVRFPYAATITKWSLVADVAGTIVVDIWKDVYANHPPTVADSIPSPKPSLSSADQNESSSLGSWTTLAIAEGDVLAFNVEATPATLTLCTLTLHFTRSIT